MEFITIFSSLDRTEISIIKHLFEENNVPYNVLGEMTYDAAGIAGSGNVGVRVQVPKDQVDRAKEVLLKNGFLGKLKSESGKIGTSRKRRKPVISRWILIVLAVMVLILVAFMVMYFMNPEA